ncbi:MAG: hypothetical protein CMJ18_26515 [Phycisphaeraceae bacterium]|nr:hypothetical protein [Phycisphaeraceae bacterium]
MSSRDRGHAAPLPPEEEGDSRLGGVIHTYRKFDPKHFPSPTTPPPDVVSGAFDHLLAYGDLDHLTDEQLANAIRIDPSQIAGLGPSLDALIMMLEQRKRKILETYETETVQQRADREVADVARDIDPPRRLARRFHRALAEEQLHDLERLWYSARDDQSPFARGLVQLLDRMGNKYLVEELAAKYEFTGRTGMTVDEALQIKEELEAIDKLLEQLEQAKETAQVALIDMDALAEFAEPGDVEQLSALQQQVQDMLRELAAQQGLERGRDGYELTPKAYRLFQSKLLENIFNDLQASRSGRHQGPIMGEGAIELPATEPYEFGDSVTHMDIPASMINAMVRGGPGLPIRMKPEDIEIHRTRNNPKCATAVLLDMSGSMRHGGLYINVKRMGLALQGLILSEYPGDFLRFIEIFSFAKPRAFSEIATLMPKPVTIWDPVVRLKADMSNPDINEMMVPPHFTNIQHGMRLARRFLSAQDTPNRQIILITDGLPTAHFEEETLFLLYPPHPKTEEATMREGMLCARDQITINIFLLSSWNQSHDDIQFAYRLAEPTKGRVFFTAGRDLDRYVVWDYVKRKKQIISG